MSVMKRIMGMRTAGTLIPAELRRALYAVPANRHLIEDAPLLKGEKAEPVVEGKPKQLLMF